MYLITADLNVVPYSNPLFGEASTRFVIQVFDDEGTVNVMQQIDSVKENIVDIVRLESPFYVPNVIQASAGEMITFDNIDGNQHTVTSVKSGTTEYDGKFDSSLLQPGDKFELTLNEKGNYDYFCALHASMQGSIIVS